MKKSPASKPLKISPARIAAFEVLQRIDKDEAFSSILLPQYTEWLDPRDRGLAHEITMGVIRRRMLLDRIIDGKAGGKKIDQAIRTSLRIGLYQMLFLERVPAHSAINESVELAGYARKQSARGFVNAILRGVLRDGTAADYESELERVSVETSHPQWLLERWAAEFGVEDAFALAGANNETPPIAFRFTARAAETIAIPADARRSEIVDGCFLADRMTGEISALADAGLIYFQDEASQIVGSAAAEIAGRSFLDVCAAPGSKATQIAAKGRFQTLIAGDRHFSRVQMLRENFRNQGTFAIGFVQYDAATVLPFKDSSFDAVLIDAPCTGTGTIRHNPEIRYRATETDISEITKKQRQILENASKLVRVGGKLLYSTCSLEIEENEDVVNAFLAEHSNWKKADPHVDRRFITADGFGRTLPHKHGLDGFFIAELKKEL
ncbi:MAG: 16S rRNA (cytosine(967)-C(5))-methyltransferase RsmB [Pyrinomonadaceae bacterium]|nr:16S rRNA (cytosine(967)-C(5))-methyltransferase RsmB [Pyrinomonadaceae bacterium]